MDQLKEYATKHGHDVIVISGKIEEELSAMEPADKIDFLKELGMKESGLDSVVRKGYEILGLRTDFLKHGSWNAAKEAGLVRTEGKEYLVQDGDIMYFLFNV